MVCDETGFSDDEDSDFKVTSSESESNEDDDDNNNDSEEGEFGESFFETPRKTPKRRLGHLTLNNKPGTPRTPKTPARTSRRLTKIKDVNMVCMFIWFFKKIYLFIFFLYTLKGSVQGTTKIHW